MVLSVPEGKRREIENKLRERRVQVIDYSIARKECCSRRKQPK